MKTYAIVCPRAVIYILLSMVLIIPSAFSQEGTNRTGALQPVNDPKQVGNHNIPDPLVGLFEKLDRLGRAKVQDCKFVELEISNEQPDKSVTEKAWLMSQDDNSIGVLRDDLITWIYPKEAVTTMPSSWQPTRGLITSITDANFEELCRELSKPKDESAAASPRNPPIFERVAFNGPGPSYRALVAHAAWKRGLTNYCEPIVSGDPLYTENFAAYQAAVLEDLAWLHFLRGVNLLMFADRSEVLPHLRLVSELSPTGEFAAQSKNLVLHIERLVEDEKRPKTDVDEASLKDTQKAALYIAQIKDLRSPQTAQPGFVVPYVGVFDGKPDEIPPTVKLKDMGMPAVPALIKALENDTPTRTVYHWRDFHRSRLVWRISDFAWHILRDITKKELGNRRIVGFTFSSLAPAQKRQVIREVQLWYANNNALSEEERMLSLFSSHDPNDWITAGKYCLEHKYHRAVGPLLEKIRLPVPFSKGELCELVAQFGDPAAKDVIRQVLTTDEHSDRMSAAIALWTLGDDTGIPVAIQYVKAQDPPYGSWDEPVWLLMRHQSKEAIAAIGSVIAQSPPSRAAEVVYSITGSITGDLSSKRREPVGCAEICPVIVTAMRRPEYTGGSINNIKVRIKDIAAKAFIVLRNGSSDRYPSRYPHVDPAIFNELEPEESKRDAQISALLKWYEENKTELSWDPNSGRLVVSQ